MEFIHSSNREAASTLSTVSSGSFTDVAIMSSVSMDVSSICGFKYIFFIIFNSSHSLSNNILLSFADIHPLGGSLDIHPL